MKNIFIGALVGGIIMFITQFLSWDALDLHHSEQQYTSKPNDILAYLNTQFDSSGGYLLPTHPPGASTDEKSKLMEDAMGKSWAQIYYHKSLDSNMVVNMVKNLITNIIMVML